MANRKVLIVVDNSTESKYAFKWAFENVLRSGDKLVLLHVQADPSIAYVLDGEVYINQAILDELRKQALANTESLIAYYNQVEKEAVATVKLESFNTLVKQGDVRAEVDSTVEEVKPQLIICGTRGMGTLKRAFLGSISDHIVHHAPCPVIVVRNEV